jgi:serine acetyltransferase
MGSVVTRSVPDFYLVVGNPARSIGAVCTCGHVTRRWPAAEPVQHASVQCEKCGAGYEIRDGHVLEITKEPALVTT